MSVRNTSTGSDKLVLEFDNGDKKAFQDILQNWSFNDEQSLIRFAMAAMIKTSDKTLTITKSDGSGEKIVPPDDFISKK